MRKSLAGGLLAAALVVPITVGGAPIAAADDEIHIPSGSSSTELQNGPVGQLANAMGGLIGVLFTPDTAVLVGTVLGAATGSALDMTTDLLKGRKR